MTVCPTTGEPTPTVFRMKPSQFDDLDGERAFRCRCGEVHRWTRADAWLDGHHDGPVGERASFAPVDAD